MKKQYGLIGERLEHSYSPRLHSLLGAYDYQLLPTPPEELDTLLRQRAFAGLNVTIPYKQSVIPYCVELSETARRIGSVNTMVRRQGGAWYGDNTDAYGFAEMARRAGIRFGGQKALVLGSGGTSRTACDVISQSGGLPVVISRNGENDYAAIEQHQDATLLVNTTPVGMYPATDAAPLCLTRLPNLRGVLDVIYNPLRTRLLQQAEEMGIPCVGGLLMLVMQAVRACEQFTGETVPKEKILGALATLRKGALNLVLVGMPGCGKTTIGRNLAESLRLPVIDIDAEIEKERGCTIPEIFEREGEAAFRKLEAAQIARFGRETGRVLITGGGAVLAAQNRESLQLNGFVVHLTRPLDWLSTRGRPLSENQAALRSMWERRAPLYAACADITIPNDSTPDACIRAIQEAYHEALYH